MLKPCLAQGLLLLLPCAAAVPTSMFSVPPVSGSCLPALALVLATASQRPRNSFAMRDMQTCV